MQVLLPWKRSQIWYCATDVSSHAALSSVAGAINDEASRSQTGRRRWCDGWRLASPVCASARAPCLVFPNVSQTAKTKHSTVKRHRMTADMYTYRSSQATLLHSKPHPHSSHFQFPTPCGTVQTDQLHNDSSQSMHNTSLISSEPYLNDGQPKPTSKPTSLHRPVNAAYSRLSKPCRNMSVSF